MGAKWVVIPGPLAALVLLTATPASGATFHESLAPVTVGATQKQVDPGGKTHIKVEAGEPTEIRNVPPATRISTTHPSTLVRTADGIWTLPGLPPESKAQIHLNHGGFVTSIVVKTKDVNRATINTTPIGQEPLGIGVSLTATFDTPVNPASRDEIISHLSASFDNETITGVEGVAKWVDDFTVRWVPSDFWPGNRSIDYVWDLSAVEISDGVWGSTVRGSFKTAEARHVTVDLNSKVLQLWEGGVPVGDPLPTSGGMPGWETPSGWSTITERWDAKRLYNPDPVDGWDVQSEWVQRLTSTGILIHSAPWNGNLGVANTSHGCINLSTSDALWLFERTTVGTPVEVVGGVGVFDFWSAPGAIWN